MASAGAQLGLPGVDTRQQVWRLLQPRICLYLTDNEKACTIRCIDHEAMVAYSAQPFQRRARLSEPVPTHAFAHKWGPEGSTYSLTFYERHLLLCLTARSGCLQNLQLAVQRCGLSLSEAVLASAAASGSMEACQWLIENGCPVTPRALVSAARAASSAGAAVAAGRGGGGMAAAAAAASHRRRHGSNSCSEHEGDHQDPPAVQVCRLLRSHGCPLTAEALAAAAEAGSAPMCQWLLRQGCPGARLAAGAAAASGHPQLMSLLLERSGNEGDRGGRGSSRSHNEPGTDGSDRMSCSSSSSMASSSSEGGGDSAAAADAQGGAIGTSQAAPAASNFSVPPIEDPLSQALTAAVRFQEHLSAGQQHQAEGAAAAAVADAVAVVEGPAPGNNLGSAQQAGLGPPPQPTPPADAYGWRYELLACAVHGCDLATAQELYGTLRTAGVNMGGSPKCRREKHGVLEGAASSQLPDWQAKVEWLESLGFPRVACTHGGRFSLAACCPNLRPRLEWLKARGYSFFAPVASAVAAKGDVDAVLFLLEEGYGHCQMDRTAARHGHLAVLTAMRDAGHVIDAKAAVAAARGGHLHVVQWLAEALGRRAVLTAEVMTVATAAGSKRLVEWLHSCGATWDASAFTAAAQAGNGELLLWMAQRGAPMPLPPPSGGPTNPHSGAAPLSAAPTAPPPPTPTPTSAVATALLREGPYLLAARNGDLLTLRTLARLGCPWACGGATLTRAMALACPADVLAALVEAGCPVNWDEAVAAAVDSYPPDSEPVRWTIMQQQQQQQQQQRQTAGITDGTYS